MDRNIKMEIELPEEQRKNFRLFIVLHGGAIITEEKKEEKKEEEMKE